MIHEDVVAKDVHNHRAEQGKPERNEAANQKKQSAGDLAESDDLDVARVHHRRDERATRSGHGRRGDEVQKGIRAEDDEHESEQDAGDDFNDFHPVMLNRTSDFSTAFKTPKHSCR